MIEAYMVPTPSAQEAEEAIGQQQRSTWGNVIKLVGVPVAAASFALGACGGGHNSNYLTPSPNSVPVAATTPNGVDTLPGTVVDGSDAAIMADVQSGRTNCGGIKGELWTDKPYTPNHMFDYYGANPEMVNGAQSFWTDVMGADALGFITDAAKGNKDADASRTLAGNDLMTRFTQKHIANTDVPEGTIERNHNCLDTNGDGKPDTIKFLDLRVAHHGDKSQEGTKRTTLAGLFLSHADFETFKQKMIAAGKNPEQLIYYEVSVDRNGDKQISDDEKLVFVATQSAICENAVLRGERPPEVTVTTSAGGVVTTESHTDTTGGITNTTGSTTHQSSSSSTPTTGAGPKQDAHPPGSIKTGTTVPAPTSGPSVATTRTTVRQPATTQVTHPAVTVTVTTAPQGGCNTC